MTHESRPHKLPLLRAVPNARPNAVVIDDEQKDEEFSSFQPFAIAVVLLCAMITVVTVSMSATASVAIILATHR